MQFIKLLLFQLGPEEPSVPLQWISFGSHVRDWPVGCPNNVYCSIYLIYLLVWSMPVTKMIVCSILSYRLELNLQVFEQSKILEHAFGQLHPTNKRLARSPIRERTRVVFFRISSLGARKKIHRKPDSVAGPHSKIALLRGKTFSHRHYCGRKQTL